MSAVMAAGHGHPAATTVADTLVGGVKAMAAACTRLIDGVHDATLKAALAGGLAMAVECATATAAGAEHPDGGRARRLLEHYCNAVVPAATAACSGAAEERAGVAAAPATTTDLPAPVLQQARPATSVPAREAATAKPKRAHTTDEAGRADAIPVVSVEGEAAAMARMAVAAAARSRRERPAVTTANAMRATAAPVSVWGEAPDVGTGTGTVTGTGGTTTTNSSSFYFNFAEFQRTAMAGVRAEIMLPGLLRQVVATTLKLAPGADFIGVAEGMWQGVRDSGVAVHAVVAGMTNSDVAYLMRDAVSFGEPCWEHPRDVVPKLRGMIERGELQGDSRHRAECILAICTAMNDGSPRAAAPAAASGGGGTD